MALWYVIICPIICCQLWQGDGFKKIESLYMNICRLNVVKCENTLESIHPPLWQTCEVLRPWALIDETTVYNLIPRPPLTFLVLAVRKSEDRLLHYLMCCQDRKDGRNGYKTHGHPGVQSSKKSWSSDYQTHQGLNM